jgi:hypothetical protein
MVNAAKRLKGFIIVRVSLRETACSLARGVAHRPPP